MKNLSVRLAGVSLSVLSIGACQTTRMPAPVIDTAEAPILEIIVTQTEDVGYSSEGVQVQALTEDELLAEPEGILVKELRQEVTSAKSEDWEMGDESADTNEADKEHVSESPAVVALLNSAKNQSNDGDHDRAAATLERAVKIEPKNALIWHHLAKVYFRQKMYREAINFATRSNALAGVNRFLIGDNWLVIGDARAALGDQLGAKSAKARAMKFLKLDS